MYNNLKSLIKEYIEEMLDEAIHKRDYIAGITNVLTGALGEYYKARYAEANGQGGSHLVSHWGKEVDNHFRFKFYASVTKATKGYGQLGAFLEALKEVQASVPSLLRWARSEVSKDFGLDVRTMQDPSDVVTDEFFARARNEFDECFE